MSTTPKQLSNPFSTGGGGAIFESRVQAAFVALMLSKGVCPCLPSWQIYKVKLQGKYSGYATDDVIIFARHESLDREAKLIAQIKHSPAITKADTSFAEVIQSAWSDFQNPSVFEYGYDALALITGPLRPSYHENLFPDISDFSTTLFGNEPSFFSPQSNTIKKAYLCHSKTTRVAEGDLLLFFRTGDRRSIEVIGVVEKAIRTQDPYLATSLVSKRTVYSQKEVSELLKKPTLIVLFRLMRYFPAIPNSRFGKIGIKEPIQTIRQISHQDFSQLMAVLPS